MEPYVFIVVLIAAAFHAGWNAVVKVGLDRFLSVTLIFLCAGFVSLCAAPFVPFPTAVAWPWLIASTILHTGYKLFLIRAYDAGDMGQVYPLARGSAPLLVSVVMMLAFGEVLTPVAMVGIMVLLAGVCLMSVRGGSEVASLDRTAVTYALGTSVFIASYTITDGLGARVNITAHSYAVWLFLLDAIMMLVILLAVRGRAGLVAMRPYWKQGIAGGCMSLAAYWIILWAMTVAPIAMVAALRESSVLFAALISVIILREPLTRWRTAAAILIVAGLIIARTT